MGAELLELVSAHRTVLVLAAILLTAIGVVQWRKTRSAELDAANIAELLERGLPVGEIVVLLRAKATTHRGVLEQFGDKSGSAKAAIISAIVMLVPAVLGMLAVSREAFVHRPHFRQHQTGLLSAPRDSRRLSFALIPERPIVFLNETGSDSCRVFVTDSHAVHGWQVAATVSAQDNADGELLVETMPVAVLQAEQETSQRYCDVRLQAVRGTGHFTVQVTATNPYSQQAQTTFSVQVGTSQPTMPPAGHDGDGASNAWL